MKMMLVLTLAITAFFMPGMTSKTSRHFLTQPKVNVVAQDFVPMRLIFGIPSNVGARAFLTELDMAAIAPLEELPYSFVDGDFSFDGSAIAYDNCGDRYRNPHGIYVAKLGQQESRKILPIAGKICVSVRWSPDGQQLSFDSPNDRQLHIINLATNEDRILPNTKAAGWHWWSPKGDEIVVERGLGGQRELFILDLEGKARQLTYLKDFANCETWAPTWSRDGNRIAFTVTERGKNKLYTIAPDGTDIKRIEIPDVAYSPRWSIDSEWIIFRSGERLMRVRKDGSGLSSMGELRESKSAFSIGPKS
jgi:Tol biopolymer transport system component